MALHLLDAPILAHAQAEVAPDDYTPPEGVPISEDPRVTASKREAKSRLWLVELQPRVVVPLGKSVDLPWVGFGFGVGLSRGLLVIGRARLGLGVSFAYERLQHTVTAPPSFMLEGSTQSLAHASFSLDLRLEGFVASGKVRPWAALGPAMSLATYADPRIKVYDVAVLPALRAGIGCAVEVGSGVEVGGRAEWLATFAGNTVPSTPPANPFRPGTFALGVDVGFRF